MNVNVVLLAGRLTRDVQMKYLANQTAVSEFSIAVNEKRKDKERAHFIDLIAFGKNAELLNQHFGKGKEIFVTGRLDYQAWDDRKTGAKRSKLGVVLESFEFVGPKTDGGRVKAREGEAPFRNDVPDVPLDDDSPF